MKEILGVIAALILISALAVHFHKTCLKDGHDKKECDDLMEAMESLSGE